MKRAKSVKIDPVAVGLGSMVATLLLVAVGHWAIDRTHKLKVGDCVITNSTLFKIVEEGEYGFDLIDVSGNHQTSTKDVGAYKVDCFNRFDKVNK